MTTRRSLTYASRTMSHACRKGRTRSTTSSPRGLLRRVTARISNTFREQGTEVLLMHDPIDEWVVTHLNEFDGKPMKSIVHGEIEAEDKAEDETATEAGGETASELLEKINTALGEKVEKVRATRRLTSSPACLVSADAQMSANLERLLKASGQDIPASKRILELKRRTSHGPHHGGHDRSTADRKMVDLVVRTIGTRRRGPARRSRGIRFGA